MTWYEWIWATVAVVLFLAFVMIVLVTSLINAQSGSVGGAFLILMVGPLLAAGAAVTWPMWFPFTFALDIRDNIRKKNE